MDDFHTRTFKEITVEQENGPGYKIRHYFNGYKRIRIKSDKTSRPVKIWFNDFLDADFELIIEPGKKITKRYSITENIEELSFNKRNVLKINLIDAKLTNKDIVLKLIEEVKLINPIEFRNIIIKIIKIML